MTRLFKEQRNCTMPTNDNRIIGEIFHEPEDSEDEKIKNVILNHLKKMRENCQDDVCGVHVEDAIAWVEKQQDCAKINERAWLFR